MNFKKLNYRLFELKEAKLKIVNEIEILESLINKLQCLRSSDRLYSPEYWAFLRDEEDPNAQDCINWRVPKG